MKIIHCSDLHLDSKLSSNLGGIIAKKRCGEILHTFKRMVDYASKNNVLVWDREKLKILIDIANYL